MKSNQFSVKSILGIILIIWAFFLPFSLLFKGNNKENSIENDRNTIKAVVINEKNYFGNNPVSQSFSYSYSFKIANTEYKGDTQNSKYSIGDTVEIEYSESNPEYNQIIKIKHP